MQQTAHQQNMKAAITPAEARPALLLVAHSSCLQLTGSRAAQALPLWTPVEQGYREAYLNAKLARKWMDPAAHPWAALDFAGVEFGAGAGQQAILHYRQARCGHAHVIPQHVLSSTAPIHQAVADAQQRQARSGQVDVCWNDLRQLMRCLSWNSRCSAPSSCHRCRLGNRLCGHSGHGRVQMAQFAVVWHGSGIHCSVRHRESPSHRLPRT